MSSEILVNVFRDGTGSVSFSGDSRLNERPFGLYLSELNWRQEEGRITVLFNALDPRHQRYLRVLFGFTPEEVERHFAAPCSRMFPVEVRTVLRALEELRQDARQSRRTGGDDPLALDALDAPRLR